MKWFVASTCLVLAGATWAQAPNFDYGHFMTSTQGYILQGNRYGKPVLGYWDNDSDLDLIVGVLDYGYLYYFKNLAGGGVAPEFAPPSIMMADGDTIAVTYS